MDVRFEFPHINQEFDEQGAVNAPIEDSKHNNIFSKGTNCSDCSILDQEILSKQFKVTIGNDNGQADKLFTVLTKSKSGTLAMELDDRMIELIEKKTQEAPFLFISLKHSDSGHLVIDFENKDNVVSNTQKVALRYTASGTKLLEMHKNLVSIIKNAEKKQPGQVRNGDDLQKCRSCNWPLYKNHKDSDTSSINESNNIYKSCPEKVQLIKNVRKCINPKDASIGTISYFPLKADSYKITQLMQDLIYITQDTDELDGVKCPKKSNASVNSIIEGDITELHDFSLELQQRFEQGDVIIMLQIKTTDSLLSKFESVITRSPSGTIGVDLVELSSLGHIPLDGIEYPVCLSRTYSDVYIVDIDQSNTNFNAVIKKSVSGNVMLIPTSPQRKPIDSIPSTNTVSDKIFKVKVIGYKNHPIDLPAVLKSTSSNNFIIVLDKEFENRYKKTVHDLILKEGECFVSLKNTSSGYVIDLCNRNTSAEKPNALLIKSKMGDIKVLVEGPIFESHLERSKSSAQVFQELLDKLSPASSTEFCKTNFRKAKLVDQKCVSDTQLYERIKVKLQINKDLFCKPSANLQRTESGQYAIVLNRKSKRTFINNLRNYLASTSQGLVPIRKTESGEILIDLNNYDEDKGHYGSLKVTSSGNVYIIVNEQAVKTMIRNSEETNKQSNVVNAKSMSAIESVNKAVTTTCNAKPDDYDCDKSKCVCEELQRERFNFLDRYIRREDLTGRPSQPICWIRSKSVSNRNSSVTNNICAHGQKSLHIVIKPDAEEAAQPYKSTEQCYYIIDTICPYHKENDSILNESDCPKVTENVYNQRARNFEFNSYVNIEPSQNGAVLWDSLSFLPPQLPPFLQNVSYQ